MITDDFYAVALQAKSTLENRLDGFLASWRTSHSMALPMPTDAMIYVADRLLSKSNDGTKTQIVISNEGEELQPATNNQIYDVKTQISLTVVVSAESQQVVSDAPQLYAASLCYCSAIAHCIDAWLSADGDSVGVKNTTITAFYGGPEITLNEELPATMIAASCLIDVYRQTTRMTRQTP